MKPRCAVISACALLAIAWEFPVHAQVSPAVVSPIVLRASADSPKLPLDGDFTVRHQVQEAQVRFIATDRSGRPVLGLHPGDVQVYDDQVRVPELKSFTLSQYAPLEVGVLVDLSDSISSLQHGETMIAADLLAEIFDTRRDKAFVVGFSNKVRLLQPETTDINSIRETLVHNPGRQGLTSLFDAIVQSCRSEFAARDSNDRQRIMLLFSDGSDTLSIHGPDEALREATRAGVTIYAITTEDADADGLRNLKRLAEQTGGSVYVIPKKKGLETLKVAMSQTVRGEYTISFRPATGTVGFHPVRIELPTRSDITLRASTGYYMGTN
ncbi:MAG TPA: VWA domain-containing protein [Terriglobales bacterium]|nr:VWA domain-containing protein [Terriglobales bacterium]